MVPTNSHSSLRHNMDDLLQFLLSSVQIWRPVMSPCPWMTQEKAGALGTSAVSGGSPRRSVRYRVTLRSCYSWWVQGVSSQWPPEAGYCHSNKQLKHELCEMLSCWLWKFRRLHSKTATRKRHAAYMLQTSLQLVNRVLTRNDVAKDPSMNHEPPLARMIDH